MHAQNRRGTHSNIVLSSAPCFVAQSNLLEGVGVTSQNEPLELGDFHKGVGMASIRSTWLTIAGICCDRKVRHTSMEGNSRKRMAPDIGI